ncbi:MAG: hypothetical protein V1672_04170 [Candidatus Diapherotrites archaeon]
MNSRILLISLIAVLVFFSGCIENEAEPLKEEFASFTGTWYWDNTGFDPENPVLYGKEKTTNAEDAIHFSEEESLSEAAVGKMANLDKIKFTINEDGTGRYMEYFSKGADFECASFVYVDKSSITFICKGTSFSREFGIIEFSDASMKLMHSELEEELNFSKMK